LNLRTLAQSFVKQGRTLKALEGAVYRDRGSVAGLGLGKLHREAQEISANEMQIRGRRGNLVPRPGRDMVPTEFKLPFKYRYVVEINFREGNGPLQTTAVSVYRNEDNLSKGAIQAQVLADATFEVGRQYWADITPQSKVVSTELINAYWNIDR
jgi:hypothetical protein